MKSFAVEISQDHRIIFMADLVADDKRQAMMKAVSMLDDVAMNINCPIEVKARAGQ